MDTVESTSLPQTPGKICWLWVAIALGVCGVTALWAATQRTPAGVW